MEPDTAARSTITGRWSVRTEFASWFGASKAVDDEGRPLVLFHGTGHSISAFRLSDSGFYGRGIYLTDDAEDASDYAENAPGATPNVMPVYALMRKPYVFEAGYAVQESTAESLIKKVLKGDARKRALATFDEQGALTDEIFQVLEDRGHDGLIVQVPGEPVEYIVFSPAQVKSAIGNRGTFDPLDPDICR